MPIQRAKILTRLTVPTGGWQLRLQFSELAQFDTQLDVTIDAGDYFMAWDQQADDLVWKVCNEVNVALDALALAGWVGRTQGMAMWIDSDHHVRLAFEGSWFDDAIHRDVRIDWTALDGADVAAVLGFDSSANLSLTGTNQPSATGDYHHAYGWYSDVDGETEQLEIEPNDMPTSEQTFGPAGHSKTQYIGSRFTNALSLRFIPRTRMWSADVSYATASVYPYARNQPLQCWFKEARKGIEFRVYRHNTVDTTIADEGGAGTGGAPTFLADAGKSWGTEPQQWPGRLLYVPVWASAAESIPMRYHIASNTATQVNTTQAAEPQLNTFNVSSAYSIFDQPYETYVLDTRAMRGGFKPRELGGGLDRFDIVIPLSRYET